MRRDGTLVIRGVEPQDGGRYVCAAQNLHGAARKAVVLSVDLQKPRVSPEASPEAAAAPEKQITALWGSTVSLACLARGTPTPRLSWILPEGFPAAGRPPKAVSHPNNTLTIRGADASHRGVYKCVAHNAAGVDVGAVRLHVRALAPEIHQRHQETISAAPGSTLRLHCTARAAPEAAVRWVLPDGAALYPAQFLRGRFYVFPNGTLYMRRLAPRDAGRYDCVASNLAGSARRSVWLAVEPRDTRDAAAAGTTAPESASANLGDTLRLRCGASGGLEPRALWRLPSKQTADQFFRCVLLLLFYYYYNLFYYYYFRGSAEV